MEDANLLGDTRSDLDGRDGVCVERQVRSMLLRTRHRYKYDIFLRQIFVDIYIGEIGDIPGAELGTECLVALSDMRNLPLGGCVIHCSSSLSLYFCL